MCTNCSFAQCISGTAATQIIAERDEDIQEIRGDDCCDLFTRSFVKVACGVGLGILFITNVIEALARLFFAAVTLPFACCDDGVNFYKKVSMQGLINAFNSLSMIAYSFFANLYENRLSKEGGMTLSTNYGTLRITITGER